ncbi:hypothetical protein BDF14DRAFT_1764169 [Spinellus fusiger]|nr:hypothetical protein BDF14DRAFT_1764169 [Spinellus fusiger]
MKSSSCWRATQSVVLSVSDKCLLESLSPLPNLLTHEFLQPNVLPFSCKGCRSLENHLSSYSLLEETWSGDVLERPHLLGSGVCHECRLRSMQILSMSIDLPSLSNNLFSSSMIWASSLSYFLLKDDIFLSQEFSFTHELICNSLSEQAPLPFPAASPIIDSDKKISNKRLWTSTPHLSPVTSPSGLLYDHEPLFEGLEDIPFSTFLEAEEEKAEEEEEEEKSLTLSIPIHHNESLPVLLQTEHANSLSNSDNAFESDHSPELEWSALVDHFGDATTTSDHLLCDLPTPSETACDDESTHSSDENCMPPYTCTPPTESLKRRRYSSIDSDHQEQVYKVSVSDSLNHRSRPVKKTDATLLLHHNHLPVSLDSSLLPKHKRKSQRPTVFDRLIHLGINWCRYCGTTESVNWRPGPWGKRTLCNKHGCDYKGYGLVSRMPRLDLSAFVNESIKDRQCPVVQEFCLVCHSSSSFPNNTLVSCEGGCSRAYHQSCQSPVIESKMFLDTPWYCSTTCQPNRLKDKVVVDLPRNHLPLMIRNQKKNYP